MSLDLAQRLQRNRDHRSENARGCHYTTLMYRSALSGENFRFYLDFEHNGLDHFSWKEEEKTDQKKLLDKSSHKSFVKKKKNQSKTFRQDELIRYFRSHQENDDRFIFDPSVGMSRRPRNVLYIDFYPNATCERVKRERTFFHQKYLLPRCIRLETMKDMIEYAEEAELNLQIIGHFILNPNSLSKEEIEMFQLRSDYGDLYEGHLIRIDDENSIRQRTILLLSSTFHADMKLTSLKNLILDDPAHLDARIDPKSTIERIVLEHVRQYFDQHSDHSIEEIRRIRMDFESDRLMIYLYDDEREIDQFPLDISRQQAIEQFGVNKEENIYFLSGIREEKLISTIEHQLKTRSISKENLSQIFQAYGNQQLTNYAREECRRVGLEYRFHDVFDRLDEINDQDQREKFIQKMIDELSLRWEKQREQRSKAEITAKILLLGSLTEEIDVSSKQNKVVLLDHHREIHIVQPENESISDKLKNLQRYDGEILVHKSVPNGPDSFHRVPMTIDSLTILKRHRQRKQLDLEDHEDEIIPLGSGLHRLITSDTRSNSHRSVRCQQDEQSEATRTNTTNSFNTSAHIEEEKIEREMETQPRRNKKRTHRSLAEHEKHRMRRKRRRTIDSTIFHRQKHHRSLLDRFLFLKQQKNRFFGKNDNQISLDSSLSEVSTMKSNQSDSEMTDESDEESSEQEMTHEEILQSLYGPLTNRHRETLTTPQNKNSRLKSTRNLSQTFVSFLHLQKSDADELAETIIKTRQCLNSSKTNQETQISILPSKSFSIMHRTVEYLSRVDERIFHYIIKEFLVQGTRITGHALEFSSALLMDLIEESIFKTYFRSRWCSDNEPDLDEDIIEAFLKEILDDLLHRLEQIHLPLLENLVLRRSLKTYFPKDLIDDLFSSDECPTSFGYHPCVWSSTDLLIKTICLFTDDLLAHANDNEFADFTKLEYVLVSYFHQVEVIEKIDEKIKEHRSPHPFFHPKSLLHIIDVDHASKFTSSSAFQQWQVVQPDTDLLTLKNLLIVNEKTRTSVASETSRKQITRSKPIPLTMDDLISDEQHSIILPSPELLNRISRRSTLTSLLTDERDHNDKDGRQNSSSLEATLDGLPAGLQTIFDQMFDQNDTDERILEPDMDLFELIDNALAAVEQFDKENQPNTDKTMQERLAEFYRHSGTDGIHLLDDALKAAKTQTKDRKKYIPIAVNIVEDRLNKLQKGNRRKRTVHFGRTLETLLIATDKDRELPTDVHVSPNKPKEPSKSIEHVDPVIMTQKPTKDIQPTVVKETADRITGLTVAQMAVLLAGHQKALQLTKKQIEQLCSKQGQTLERIQTNIQEFVQTHKKPEKFELTDEQLVRIAMAEKIHLEQIPKFQTPTETFRLTSDQILSLMNQIKSNQDDGSSPTLLTINLDQLHQLCKIEPIDTSSEKSASSFTLTSSQMAQLINQHQFDLQHLYTLEKHCRTETESNKPFMFTPAQWAYLLDVHSTQEQQPRSTDQGLSVSQLIGLIALQQQTNRDSPLCLTFAQIEQLAVQQNKNREFLKNIPRSKQTLRLTDDQCIHIAQENQISLQQIAEVMASDEQSIGLDRSQIDNLINANNQVSNEQISLTMEQIHSLAQNLPIDFDQLNASTKENLYHKEFRLKPEQIARLWPRTNFSFELIQTPISSFHLIDEQFSSLLGLIPSPTHTPTTQSESPLSLNESPTHQQQIPRTSSLTQQYISVRNHLISNIEQRYKTTQQISTSILKREQLNHSLDLIRQLSLHAIDDLSTKDIQSIPSVVIDLLKTDSMDRSKSQLTETQIDKIRNEFLTPKLSKAFQTNELPKHLLDAYKSYSPLQIIQQVRSSTKSQPVPQKPIIIAPESSVERQNILDELHTQLDAQILRLREYYGIEPIEGQPTLQQIAHQVRTMPYHVKFQSILGRSIDEVDVLNILEGNTDYFRSSTEIDVEPTIEQHRRDRSDRIDRRLELFNTLRNHLEEYRLHRPLTTEELIMLASENIAKFEEITQLKLTETDLRILSMDRFASIEETIDRSFTVEEYHHLLETNQPAKYIEDKILCRPLTVDEHIEQNESIDQSSSSDDWQQILRRRAESVDQYALIHRLSPLFNQIENELDRSLSIEEKKRLISDDYSILQRLKEPFLLPITASIVEQVETTQDKDLIAHLEHLENVTGRTLTKQDIIAITQGDLVGLEKSLGQPLPSDSLRMIYENRSKDLEETLDRQLSNEELTELLKGKLTNVEKALGRSLTSEELSKLKSVNVVDLTASQLTSKPSNENILEELADTIQRQLSLDEIQLLTDRVKRRTTERLVIDSDEHQLIENQVKKTSIPSKESLHGLVFEKPLEFPLHDIEKAVERRLTSDELQTFLNPRADRIEDELGQSLTDMERANLLQGDHLTIESLLGRKLTIDEGGPHTVDVQTIEKILNRTLTLDELTKLADDRFDQITTILRRPLDRNELIDLLNGSNQRMKDLIEAELDRKKEQELKEPLIHRIRDFERVLRRPLSSEELMRFADHRFPLWSSLTLSADDILNMTSGHFEPVLHRSITSKEQYQYDRKVLESFLNDVHQLDEIESIIQRRLTYPELCRLAGNRFDVIERRLGRILAEEQLRHLLNGEEDPSLVEAKDLLIRSNETYADDRQRTKRVARRLLDALVMPIDDDTDEDEDEIQEETPTVSPSIQSEEASPIKAFEPIDRRVEYFAQRESIEDREMLNEIVDRASILSKKSSLTSIEKKNETTSHPQPRVIRPKDDVLLGWTLFKGNDDQSAVLRLEKPRTIQVKHFAKTCVVGIPEEYADKKSKILAHRIYRGDILRPQISKFRRPRTLQEYISETFHLPLISDATHFIVPSRAYEDTIDVFETNESNMIDIEDQDLQGRDSPETVEWHEECLQRNIQIHAQIPFGHQPSILYCYTGRRLLISPAKRDEQRRASMMGINREERRISNIALSTLKTTNFPVTQSTSQRVMDLITKTISRSEKTDLLEAIEELFSEANLDQQFMDDSDWQEIFLILLNSYLRSNSSNRKMIFKRLTDQLNQLRRNEHRRSTGTLPSISIATPMDRSQQDHHPYGFRASIDSSSSSRSSHDNLHLPPIIDVNARNESASRRRPHRRSRIKVMQTEDSFSH